MDVLDGISRHTKCVGFNSAGRTTDLAVPPPNSPQADGLLPAIPPLLTSLSLQSITVSREIRLPVFRSSSPRTLLPSIVLPNSSLRPPTPKCEGASNLIRPSASPRSFPVHPTLPTFTSVGEISGTRPLLCRITLQKQCASTTPNQQTTCGCHTPFSTGEPLAPHSEW